MSAKSPFDLISPDCPNDITMLIRPITRFPVHLTELDALSHPLARNVAAEEGLN